MLWQGNSRSEAGFSPINVTAAVAVIALVAVLIWQTVNPTSAANGNSGAQNWNARNTGTGDAQAIGNEAATASSSARDAANVTSSDLLAAPGSAQAGPNDFSQVGTDAFGQLIGTYVALKQSGAYTSAQGDRIASNVADALQADVAYAPYAESDITTDPDTSFARMLRYRSDLRVALAPLLDNSRNELEIFGHYIETRDPNDLAQLKTVAGRYRKAAENTVRVTTPRDAVSYHLSIVNALLQFGTTLDAMIQNANDSMATLALLRAYNTAEENVFVSFNSLASYEKRKIP